MKKVVTIVGARPQFVKAAVVSHALKTLTSVNEVLVHTGQHYDPLMSDVFFQDLDLPDPAYHLNVGSHAQGKQTGRMLEAIESVLIKEKPEGLLVYGDTNSTLAGALAAAKLSIPIAHVESGMRSYNRKMPEEVNRVVTDHVSTILYCSSDVSVKNLETEGILTTSLPPRTVLNIGDVMLDAVIRFSEAAEAKSKILEGVSESFVLVTIHRAENTDDPVKLRTIFQVLSELSDEGHTFVIPLHPRTRKALEKLGELPRNLGFTPPVSYLDMLKLEKHAVGIVTDSGGVQKEAYFFKTPTMTLRDQTEWTETLDCGINRLAPIEVSEIRAAFEKMLSVGPISYKNVYGDGAASHRIAKHLEQF